MDAAQLLGRTIVNPDTLRDDTTSSTTLVAVDPAAFGFTFTAPDTGQVRVVVDAYVATIASSSTGKNEYVVFGLYQNYYSNFAGTEKSMLRRGVNADGSGQTAEGRARYEHILTGLTPGMTYSMQLGFRGNAGAAVHIYSGGPTLGPTIISVFAENPVAHPGPTSCTPNNPVTLVSDGMYNSFPGLVMCDNGDLLAAYRQGVRHATGPGYVMTKRSTDGGATWGAAVKAISGGTSVDYGTATLSKLPDGRLVLTTWTRDWTTTPQTLYPNGVKLHISSDNGKTWPAVRVVDTGGDFAKGSVSESPVSVADDGSWVITVYGFDTDDTTHYRVMTLRSFDEGVTWQDRVKFADPNRSFNEGSVNKLPGGRLVLTVRDEVRQVWTGATSDDNGCTWTPLTDQILSLAAPKGVVIDGLIYFIGRHGPQYAARLIVSDGDTWWEIATLAKPNTYRCAYGQVAKLANGNLGIIRAMDDAQTSGTASLYWQTVSIS